MRLFGSIESRMAEMAKMPEPQVGMGATIHMHSDRHAVTIIEVLNPLNPARIRVVVQEDKAKLVKGSCQTEEQEYKFTRNPKGQVRTFSKRKNGLWIEEGHDMKNGSSLTIGERDEYYDPTF